MDDLRTQQIEALKVASDYSKKIIVALDNIIKEYTVERKEDTDDYLQHILKGLNWIFEVYNSTKELLKEDGSSINKDEVNQYVLELNEANQTNDDSKRAEALKGILTFVEEFQKEASKY